MQLHTKIHDSKMEIEQPEDVGRTFKLKLSFRDGEKDLLPELPRDGFGL